MKTLIIFLLLVCTFSTANTCPAKSDNPDSTELIDVVFDLYFVGSSAMHVITTGTGWSSLALDLGCLFIPGATGAGTISREGKYLLTGAAHSAHAAKSGVAVARCSKELTEKVLSRSLASGKFIKWTETFRHSFLRHVAKRHGSDALIDAGRFNVGLADDARQAQNLFNEVLEMMGSGNFIMKNCEPPYSAVMICVDMGRNVGTDGGKPCQFINMILHNKGGTMYPVTDMYKASKKEFNYESLRNLFPEL
jgi:hypothetical protein